VNDQFGQPLEEPVAAPEKRSRGRATTARLKRWYAAGSRRYVAAAMIITAFFDRVETVRPDDPVVIRLVRVALSVEVRDRVLIIAGQAFIAVVPLMIIVATLFTPEDGLSVANTFIERFNLDDETADAMTQLFAKPPEAGGGVGIISWILVLVSISSLARTIRRTFERAWGLPVTHGAEHSVEGLLGIFVLVIMGFAVGWLRETTDLWVGLVGGLGVAAVGWLISCHLFLGRRLRMRDLVPGALYGSAAQVVVTVGVTIYLPHLMERYLSRYGLIGVSFALVSWLIVVASLVVSVAVVSAQVVPRTVRDRAQAMSDHPDQQQQR
jgi:membrane protein